MRKQNLTIIGMGDFGNFMVPYLTSYFNVTICDPLKDLAELSKQHKVSSVKYNDLNLSDIVILAIPFKAMAEVIASIKAYLKPNCLVMDVASVKTKPMELLMDMLPQTIEVIGLHPLFGPQSGKNGIKGLNVAVVQGRGDRHDCVIGFLKEKLCLNLIICTAKEHDIQMAYVQGLTHLIAKSFNMMDIPHIIQTTKTYDLLNQMIALIKNDSDDLFQSILMDNPYVKDVRDKFFKSMRDLESKLKAI